MTRTKQASKSVKPTLAELEDEALDRVTGGGGVLVALGDGSVRNVSGGTKTGDLVGIDFRPG